MQPRVWYTVWAVPQGQQANLGLHNCRWAQLPIPGGRCAGSGWRLRRAERSRSRLHCVTPVSALIYGFVAESAGTGLTMSLGGAACVLIALVSLATDRSGLRQLA